jgi:hypothetical protein
MANDPSCWCTAPATSDYFLEAGTMEGGRFRRLDAFDLDVHAFREDESYRCFHIDLDKLQPDPYTTTLVELRLNREPMPPEGVNRVFWFLPAVQP